jgi:hypothetical protein
VKATCATITGCDLKDNDATATVKVCTLPQRRAAEATGAPLLEARADPSVFACDEDGDDAIIWPDDYIYSAQIRIRELLEERNSVLEREGKGNGYTEIRANALDFTAFYYVDNLGPRAKEYFASNEVKEVNLPILFLRNRLLTNMQIRYLECTIGNKIRQTGWQEIRLLGREMTKLLPRAIQISM